MISGHLTKKKGYWYIILSLRKEDGRKAPRWFSTGLKIKGNKQKAEEQLVVLRNQFASIELSHLDSLRMSFQEYLQIWLHEIKAQVSPSTFESYSCVIRKTIVPYFENKKILLYQLKPIHLEFYYHSLLEKGLSGNTVLRHHAIIHKSLNDAVHKELILKNPASIAWHPSKEVFNTTPYSASEIHQLFDAIDGHLLEVPIKLATFYGLRRSELLGLRWKSIDFEQGTIVVNHTFQRIHEEGTVYNVARDKVKRKSSYRTMPMPEQIRNLLIEYRFSNCNNKFLNPEEYLFLDKNGDVIKPGYLSMTFSKILKDNKLRHIRLHDLRHSSAGVLISNRVPLIEVQQWLGHSTIRTTADFYSHLEYAVKENSATVMDNALFN